MQRTALCQRLDDRLRTDDYADLDASANGLQVGSETGTVDHVVVAVDAARATIDAAVDAGGDLLVTHHGMVWGGIERVTDRHYDLLRALIEGDLGLYVSHLPLDGHQHLGNAAGVADVLGMDERKPFGELGPEYVGQRGSLADPSTPEDLVASLEGALDTGGRDVRVLPFGPDRIESVGIVTGSGADWLSEAADLGLDALVTGEGKQQMYHEAREAGVTVVLGGHYATETFGVRSLQELFEDWGLETTYVDHPTGL